MELRFLDEAGVAEALQSALADPYSNAPLIADLAARRGEAEFVHARNGTAAQGLLSFHDMPSFPNIALRCDDAVLFQSMLGTMAARYPQLQAGATWCLADEKTLDLLRSSVTVESAREELQMGLDLAFHVSLSSVTDMSRVVPLTSAHESDLTNLYRTVPPEVWRPEELHLGPYRGIYEAGQLVAAAGVHWVSPWISEIGNVAVHPDYRRRGLAQACVGAVVEELKSLSQRAYLMVFADNRPAVELYLKMGFEEVQRLWLVEFRLQEASSTD